MTDQGARGNLPISAKEAEGRRGILADTRHSIEMDGGRVPDDVELVHARWARGEITLEEMKAEVRRLYPTSHRQSH